MIHAVQFADGKVTYRNGQHTGELPGRLVRGARVAATAPA